MVGFTYYCRPSGTEGDINLTAASSESHCKDLTAFPIIHSFVCHEVFGRHIQPSWTFPFAMWRRELPTMDFSGSRLDKSNTRLCDLVSIFVNVSLSA